MSKIGSTLLGGIANFAAPAPMVLDTVVFLGSEVPSAIRMGSRQGVVIHRLPGGGRVIDMMGPDEGAVQWQGLLAGPDASSKAMLLSAMLRAGGARQLSFGDTVLSVVITRFEYTYQSQGLLIPYSIRVEVLDGVNILGYAKSEGSVSASIALASAESFIGAAATDLGNYLGLTTVSAQTDLAAATADVGVLRMALDNSAMPPSAESWPAMQTAFATCRGLAAQKAGSNLDDVSSASDVLATVLACSVTASAAMAYGYVASSTG